ncbi:MarR family transcriptional regulator [Methylobacterium terricola]|uniref:MarR family transcriptional regulator n=1 Tax=Methylobacterium terricola TaxID=2583531 RepID=A0A5C4L854_9HYPH|nr:MarR family transcriptional regulator [Methylobacterium terricola]TNC08340.1 MarR family transcriptional regulator [Methylobacterium terricola]
MTKSQAGKSSGRASADRAARRRVDDIVQQWRTERPDIDPVPAQIYGLIGRIHIQSTAFIDEILAPYQLVRGTFDVLTALRRAGAPYSLTPKALAESLLLSGAGLNSRINRLEDIRYIARLPEPADRRTVRIQLTTAGESVINDVIPQVFEAQWRRLRALDDDSMGRLVTELSRLADAIDAIKS